MSTRSYIRVILKEEDRNRDMMFTPNAQQAIDLKNNPWYKEAKEGCWEKVNAHGKEALRIYHHWDGYIEGVGKTLYEKYNTYEDALNLVLGGDVSTINGTYTPYATRMGEEWENIKPQAIDEDAPIDEEYDYMFKDGEWFVRSLYDETCHDVQVSGEEWASLKDIFEKEL